MLKKRDEAEARMLLQIIANVGSDLRGILKSDAESFRSTTKLRSNKKAHELHSDR